MNVVQKTIIRLDDWQQRSRLPAFLHAVVKKSGDDQVGRHAALVTYYGFLSLFPLILVLTTVAGVFGRNHPQLGQQLVDSVSGYFPVVGQSLDKSVKGLTKNGPALVIGLLFTLYGARGVADSFRHSMNDLWRVPINQRSGWPRSLARSILIIIGGGGGFILASVIAGWMTAASLGWWSSLLSVICNLLVLYLVFMLIFKLSLPRSQKRQALRLGALVAALGLAILQTVGGIIFAREARHLTDLYSALFATTLGLLTWIYLQAQVVLFAVEVNVVRRQRLWPRSLSGQRLTTVDQNLKAKA